MKPERPSGTATLVRMTLTALLTLGLGACDEATRSPTLVPPNLQIQAAVVQPFYYYEGRPIQLEVDPTQFVVSSPLPTAAQIAETSLASLGVRVTSAEALSHLEKAHRRSPESAETAFFYGYTRLALGEEKEGLALIEEALEKKPRMRYGEPYLLTGDVYAKRGRWDAAIPWYEAFTRLSTESVEGFYKLGRCYAEVGRADEARAALAGAVTAYRQAPRYIRRSARPWYWKARWRRRTA